MNGAPLEVLRRVPLFSDLDDDELDEIAALFQERDFDAGATIIEEGSGGSGFYVIEAGSAQVLIQGQPESPLQAGDYFGEVALIDDGPRMATVMAATRLDTWALTPADFRALVEARGVIGWKLLQRMARMLREERRHRPAVQEPQDPIA
jgi:CRP-like cAMP-binding protein